MTLRIVGSIFAIAIACAGCVPFKTYDVPAVEGVVRDSETKAPVMGAQILVRSKKKTDLHSTGASDATGHFSAPEVAHTIWMPPLPFDQYIPDCTILVSAPGYANQEFDFYDTLRTQRKSAVSSGVELDLKHQ